MHGAPSWREPAGRHRPVAASYIYAGNHVRKPGSTVTIDAAQDIQADRRERGPCRLSAPPLPIATQSSAPHGDTPPMRSRRQTKGCSRIRIAIPAPGPASPGYSTVIVSGAVGIVPGSQGTLPDSQEQVPATQTRRASSTRHGKRARNESTNEHGQQSVSNRAAGNRLLQPVQPGTTRAPVPQGLTPISRTRNAYTRLATSNETPSCLYHFTSRRLPSCPTTHIALQKRVDCRSAAAIRIEPDKLSTRADRSLP